MTAEPSGPREELFEAPAILAEDAILFPEMEVNMAVHDPSSVAAATQAFKEHNLLVLIPSQDLSQVVGSIGTLVLLRRTVPLQGSGAQSLWKGLWRVKVDSILGREPYVRVRFSRAGAHEERQAEKTPLMRDVFKQIDEFIKVIPGIPGEIIAFLKGMDSPGKLADLCAYSPFFTREERLDLLRTLEPEKRLQKVHVLFERQLDRLKTLAKKTSIMECGKCMDLADRAFEAGPNVGAEVAREFLEHLTREHPDELLGLVAERYGPSFMRRRALK